MRRWIMALAVLAVAGCGGAEAAQVPQRPPLASPASRYVVTDLGPMWLDWHFAYAHLDECNRTGLNHVTGNQALERAGMVPPRPFVAWSVRCL